MGDRFPQITSSEFIRALEKLGFRIRRITGSHVIMRHPVARHIAVIPSHSGDMSRGLIFGVLKQAGISSEDLIRVL